MSVVSLFSGCGGLDLGFAQEDFRLVHAIDHDHAATAVYKLNLGGSVETADVEDYDFRHLRETLENVDVVLGGFPCQGFSKAGPKKAEDPRNALYTAMHRAVETLRPKMFVAENVEGLAQNFQGRLVEQIRRDFEELDYRVEVRLLDASSFGVPQYRRRLIFVGQPVTYPLAFRWPAPITAVTVRNGEASRPKSLVEPLHGLMSQGLFELPPAPTVSDAIGDLRSLQVDLPDHVTDTWPAKFDDVIRAIGPGQKLCNVRHGPESVRTWEIPSVYGPVSTDEILVLETIARNRRHKRYGQIPNGNPLPVEVIEELTHLHHLESMLESLVERRYLKKKNGGYDLLGAMFNSGLFKRPRWHEPSPTVLTNFSSPRFFLHPLEDRPFSIREAARLQGFPDNFQFLDAGVTPADAYRLIGNAVPPPLARAIAAEVRAALKSAKTHAST